MLYYRAFAAKHFNRNIISRYVIIFLVISLHLTASGSSNNDISNHVRKCCIGGLRHGRVHGRCEQNEYEVTAIPSLWRGLCVSTYGVCCSRELEKQHCMAGRLAALTGSRCNEQFNTTSYADCCRSCQVGLAVKVSETDCTDALFAYFAEIESYRICCNGTIMNEAARVKQNVSQNVLEGYVNSVELVENTGDGTIVLRDDDDDICGKVPNLCAHVCENTNEAYRCKCNPGYKLDANNVTCSPTTESVSDSTNKVGNPDEVAVVVDHDNDKDEDTEKDDDGAEIEVDKDADSNSKCSNGYKYDNIRHRCIDIDECILSKANCKNNQYCHNTIGSYHCLNIKSKNCGLGYRFNMKIEKCEDIDECLEQIDDCTVSQHCSNTVGSFTCQQKRQITVDKQTCKIGLIYSTTTQQCEDYNECTDLPCEENYKCVNYAGGYECEKTNRGYIKTDGISVGDDIVSGDQQIFQLAVTGQQDKCGLGFQFKHGRCMDIDECITDENACDSSQVCTNDIGGYHCDCKIGYNLESTTNACTDINECSINNHNCLPTQRCDNTVGSYICTRLQSCGTGYTLNAETGNCDDDDECALNTHNCTPDYECYNTKGSFRCYRRPPPTTTTSSTTTTTTTRTPPPSSNMPSLLYDDGYTHYRNNTQYIYPAYVSHQTYNRHQLRDYGPKYNAADTFSPCDIGFHRNHLGACVDMNECVLNNPCGTHQRCINTNGSYRCQNLLQCTAGYRSNVDGSTCIDIDECASGEHSCAENQICRNRNGGYICACPPGHQLARLANGINRCLDINECELERSPVCPSNAQCLNTIGSYYCECKSGFQKSRDNDRICLDVDECQGIPGLCQQKCVNFWGGYRCTCNAGYELSADNRTCNDVDECEVHKSYKLCMGFCNNIPGSYDCSCPRGYTLAMDKNTCRDIDECASGEFCTGTHDICTNIRGSYKCTTIHCPYGYVNDPDQKNRCRQTSNLCEGDECYNKPSAYTYNFITLVSKLLIPPEGRIIFSLRGPLWYDDVDFVLNIVKIQVAANIEKATDKHFDMIKGKHEVHLSLKRALEGPQDIELELSMTVFTNGMPRGKSVAKIFILVSQYTF